MAQWYRICLPMQETQVQSSGSRRSPGEGNGNPLPYSCLGNPMDRGAWRTTVHGVAKSRIQFSDETTTGSLHKEFFVLLGKQYRNFPTICYRKQYLRITENRQFKRENNEVFLALTFLLASHAAAANSWGLGDTTLREVSVFTWTVIKTINWLSNFCNGLEIY